MTLADLYKQLESDDYLDVENLFLGKAQLDGFFSSKDLKLIAQYLDENPVQQ